MATKVVAFSLQPTPSITIPISTAIVTPSNEPGHIEIEFIGGSFQDLLAAMKMLGLNPMEQEIIDLTNNIVRNGYIYFPEFCKVILKKFREDDEELFNQNMFKVDEMKLNFKQHSPLNFF